MHDSDEQDYMPPISLLAKQVFGGELALDVRANPAIIDRRLKYLRELGGSEPSASDIT